ncbi:hypothetical protein AKJ09_05203 [Labilithrix luteola]|uniref:Lipid/polyisoprenoid-binding YceI-like domain-containing protein n=1 Tax=Labilithrix luteola TaxID=1391654 RepID=A0A0K1PZF7_9BACT|nr:YceI family protein [Labilithrix luteola]AKU98539.1 hypothetical protein AKJ09_05203 [Labilithrix luteola]
MSATKSKVLLVVPFLALVPLTAGAALGPASQSSVTFDAAGPGGMKIEGTTKALAVREDGPDVRVTVALDGLATGIALRDRHMREKYLEVAKYPTAEFVVPRGNLQFPKAGAVSGDADGTITIHGVSRPAKIHYTARPGQDGIDVTGATQVKMTDFGINVPSYLGVTVKPNVDIAVTFHTKDS